MSAETQALSQFPVSWLIRELPVDVDDATLFPNIAEAREHARRLRDNAVGIDRSVVEGGAS